MGRVSLVLLSMFAGTAIAVWETQAGKLGAKAKSGRKKENLEKFIILATPRSGSTWLTNMLGLHPEVTTHDRECFGKAPSVYDGSIQKCVTDFVKTQKLRKDDGIEEVLEAMFALPESAESTAVGFKWMVNQFQNTSWDILETADYLNREGIKIIALTRDNHLRQCNSLFDLNIRAKLGMSAMEYRHRSSLIQETYSPTHSIPLDFWERCLALYEERRSHMFGLIKKMDMKNVLIVEYADMCSNSVDVMGRMQSFLGLEAEFNVDDKRQNIAKIHSGGIRDVVENWDENVGALLSGRFGAEVAKWQEGTECGA